MKRIQLVLVWLSLTVLSVNGRDILVSTADEFSAANKTAKAGDQIILKSGEWKNVTLRLTCNGTSKNPIIVKAQKEGTVYITGNSMLKIGGSFITVMHLQFINGFSGDDPVIAFRISENELANNCRVAYCVIDDYNNPKRLQDNYWISLYGKNNRIDHCTFLNKKNLGVLLAVHLDDERSRENFHAIDHNYFGKRIPLASNAGEIIRIGVSQHCQFNSNTVIANNYFEHCDGEGEIISIKSCQNKISRNVFKECQGSVVLRHGNDNIIESNVFLGNNKEGTGGVRIINKGQLVLNNFFFQCRGEGFRSPLCIMNGVPNSPANRYVEVSDAIISNNSFYECSPASFCEGSDKERSVAPHNVEFLNNVVFNSRDSILFYAYDDISKIYFKGNSTNALALRKNHPAFLIENIQLKKYNSITIPIVPAGLLNKISDSIKSIARLSTLISDVPGIKKIDNISAFIAQITNESGAKYDYRRNKEIETVKVNCKTSSDIIKALNEYKNKKLTINLVSQSYAFDSAMSISCNLTITSSLTSPIHVTYKNKKAPHLIYVNAGHSLSMKNIQLNLEDVESRVFISTDTSGNPNHSSLVFDHCKLDSVHSIFFNAALSSVCDSIVVRKCTFDGGEGILFNCQEEKDKNGYYNVEKFIITSSVFLNRKAEILHMLRSGNDESTLGPRLHFENNLVKDCTSKTDALLTCRGVQFTRVEGNIFTNCNENKTLIDYEDWVRAWHVLKNNKLTHCGRVKTNGYVKTL